MRGVAVLRLQSALLLLLRWWAPGIAKCCKCVVPAFPHSRGQDGGGCCMMRWFVLHIQMRLQSARVFTLDTNVIKYEGVVLACGMYINEAKRTTKNGKYLFAENWRTDEIRAPYNLIKIWNWIRANNTIYMRKMPSYTGRHIFVSAPHSFVNTTRLHKLI